MPARPHPFDSVRLVRPVEEFPAGTRAIVIEEYPASDAYLIEILDEDGEGRDVVYAVADDLERVGRRSAGARVDEKQSAA
jgi:hypothetical protein